MDCGAACLASIAAFYGLRISLKRACEMAGTDERGTSLRGLLQAAKQMNFEAKCVKAISQSLDGMPLPAILHLQSPVGLQHFVVAYRLEPDRIHFMDPAVGAIVCEPYTLFNEKWSGIALLLLPRFSPVVTRASGAKYICEGENQSSFPRQPWTFHISSMN